MPGQIVESLCRYAEALAFAGRETTAAELLAASEALLEEVGGSFSWILETNESTLAEIRTQLDDTTLAGALERGRRLTVDDAVALALASVDNP